jgi:hypothetical protein
VQEYLDSHLADDKDDAARATTKRRSKPYDRTAERANISDKFASRGGANFNGRNFFRGFSQFNGDGSRGQQQQFVGKCFYCNQQGRYARFCPLKEPQQQRHSELPRTRHQRDSDDHIISTKTTVNEVEYNFDIDINYEVKSGKYLY